MAKKSSKKSTPRKKSAKKAPARKATKPASKKKSAKKKTAKKVAKKPSKKKVTKKKTAKKAAKKTVAKKKVAKKVTKKKTTKAKPAAKADAPDKPVKIKKIKTPLSAKELRHYRELLTHKRAEILGDMDSMSQEALRNHDSSNLSHMPLHMADVGSDNHEQELMLGLVESERKLVGEINEALVRIRDKTFGVCEATGKVIGKPRLEAKPWAKYCIEHARELEANNHGRRF